MASTTLEPAALGARAGSELFTLGGSNISKSRPLAPKPQERNARPIGKIRAWRDGQLFPPLPPQPARRVSSATTDVVGAIIAYEFALAKTRRRRK